MTLGGLVMIIITQLLFWRFRFSTKNESFFSSLSEFRGRKSGRLPLVSAVTGNFGITNPAVTEATLARRSADELDQRLREEYIKRAINPERYEHFGGGSATGLGLGDQNGVTFRRLYPHGNGPRLHNDYKPHVSLSGLCPRGGVYAQQAKDRSTTQRRGSSTKPRLAS